MLKKITWKNISKLEQTKILKRPIQTNDTELRTKVQNIIETVRASGDEALKNLTRQYDGVAINNLQVGADEFASARNQVSNLGYKAMLKVIEQLNAFHSQRTPIDIRVETSPGIV
jgi:histidinol dehydrogenase